jgi:hypothetical protein
LEWGVGGVSHSAANTVRRSIGMMTGKCLLMQVLPQ